MFRHGLLDPASQHINLATCTSIDEPFHNIRNVDDVRRGSVPCRKVSRSLDLSGVQYERRNTAQGCFQWGDAECLEARWANKDTFAGSRLEETVEFGLGELGHDLKSMLELRWDSVKQCNASVILHVVITCHKYVVQPRSQSEARCF